MNFCPSRVHGDLRLSGKHRKTTIADILNQTSTITHMQDNILGANVQELVSPQRLSCLNEVKLPFSLDISAYKNIDIQKLLSNKSVYVITSD